MPGHAQSFIIKSIRKFGGDHPVVQVIIDMYQQAATTLLVNGEEYEGFAITGGVSQGCPLSGSIFVL